MTILSQYKNSQTLIKYQSINHKKTAFNSFVGRASNSLIRCAGSHCSILNVQNRHLGGQFPQFSPFSTAAATESEQLSDVPDGYSLRDFDSGMDREIYLNRQLEDETIEVRANFDQSSQNVQVLVDISNGNLELSFEIFARRPHQMHIREMSVSETDRDLYQNFWEIRGLKPSTINFLFDYIKKRDELWSKGIGLKLLRRPMPVADDGSTTKTETPFQD